MSKQNIADMKDLAKDIEESHRLAVAQGFNTYVDPATGYNVFTAEAHKKRGVCCGNSCRHCPFNHINVKQKQS